MFNLSIQQSYFNFTVRKKSSQCNRRTRMTNRPRSTSSKHATNLARVYVDHPHGRMYKTQGARQPLKGGGDDEGRERKREKSAIGKSQAGSSIPTRSESHRHSHFYRTQSSAILGSFLLARLEMYLFRRPFQYRKTNN
jgi:hypothetical protein